MRIHHRGAHVGVAQQFLNRPNITTRLEKVGRETVPKSVAACRRRDAGFANRQLHRALDGFLVNMVANRLTGEHVVAIKGGGKDLVPSPLLREIRIFTPLRFDAGATCIYNTYMRLTWDETKRRANLRDHEIDFIDAERVFALLTATFEDDRFAYHEQRGVTLGLLDGNPVSIVHTESEDEIRVISFRRATTHEEEILFASIEDQLPPATKPKSLGRKDYGRAPGNGPKSHRPSDRPKRTKRRPT